MGQQNVQQIDSQAGLRRFTRQLIQDVRALERMLEEGLFETDVRRIGAEQEMFLVNDRYGPDCAVERVLERTTDPRLVTELNKFNLEFNLDPLVFGGDCLGRLEQNLLDGLEHCRSVAAEVGTRIALCGILPTIHLSDLGPDSMTPSPRYYALRDIIDRLRGGPGTYQIRGVDELFLRHDGIALEGCNTSFQTHFQVAPGEFARLYNIAQLVAAPVLAAAVNSPILFGKRLWRETRIALFQQAIDTRSTNLYLREMSPRVDFGTSWVEASVAELFKEDIARFRILLTTDELEDPFEKLDKGEAPKMRALALHNGTVYRWNRACYGITDGKPHLRIENRILPSGPTPVDEVANAAFWFGLVSGLAATVEDVRDHLDFDHAKGNFLAAARLGLSSQLAWLDGRRVPAHRLICDELLPVAQRGLEGAGIDGDDVDRLLGIIEARVISRQTGAQWQLDSLQQMRGKGTRAERLSALVAAMMDNQAANEPVHAWPLAGIERVQVQRRLHSTRVEHYMSTDLFTVNEEESVELVACLMDWRKIRHVLVENEQHALVGLVTHRSLLRHLAARPGTDGEGTPVKELMTRDLITVAPETSTVEAIRLMRDRKIGSLPVVREGQLIGIVTENDFIHIVGELLDESMGLGEA